MPGKRVFPLILALVAAMFVIAACEEEVIPTQEPVEFHPTAAAPVERSGGSSEPAVEAPAESGGDAANGEALFSSCSACHSTSDATVVGPGLAGVYDRAGSRTSLDADAYIAQSIREPGEFVVDGFANLMPPFSASQLSDQDVQDVIAYLKTLN